MIILPDPPTHTIYGLSYHLSSTWNLPFHIRDHLDHYYLLHWRTEYFFAQQHTEMIDHQGIAYDIAYFNNLPLTLRAKYNELLLSFRKAANAKRGIVLVRGKFGTEKE